MHYWFISERAGARKSVTEWRRSFISSTHGNSTCSPVCMGSTEYSLSISTRCRLPVAVCGNNSVAALLHTFAAYTNELLNKLPCPGDGRPKHPFHLIARAEKERLCSHCYYNQQRRSNTPYICETCSVPLHPDCFKDYHEWEFFSHL